MPSQFFGLNIGSSALHAYQASLNTTANILAGTTTAASTTATVFNATQIKAIKKVAEIAEKCTGALR